MPKANPAPGRAVRRGHCPDAGDEADAFNRLEALDVPGCRRAFARLTRWIRADGHTSQADARATVLWLHGVLLEVHRRLTRVSAGGPEERDGSGLPADRWDFCRRFAGIDCPNEARAEFHRCLDALLEPWEGRRPDSRPVVERARLLIRQNYQSRISLSSVAARLHVSANYLSRQFRRETGVTLTRYIQQVRLEHARRLLSAGGRSISEVAYLVGYQNYRDFHRNFVKYEKASPSEVVRRMTSGR